VEARFFVQTGHGVHHASYTTGTGSLPVVKQPEHGVNNPPPSSAEVDEREELASNPPLDLRGLF